MLAKFLAHRAFHTANLPLLLEYLLSLIANAESLLDNINPIG